MEKFVAFLFFMFFLSLLLICGITLFRISLKKEIHYLKQAKTNDKARKKALHWFVWGIQIGLTFIGLAIIFLVYGIIAFFNQSISQVTSWIIVAGMIFTTQWTAGRLLKHLQKKYY